MDADSATLPAAHQERSRRTRERILEAALEVMATEGVDALTIAKVAEAAGVGVGSVYRRFGEKRRLTIAAIERFTVAFRTDLFRALDAIPPGAPDAGERALRAFVATCARHAGPMTSFMVLGLGDSDIAEVGRRASRIGGDAFVERLGPAPRHARRAVYRLAYAATSHRLVFGPDMVDGGAWEWDEIADDLVVAARGLLGRSGSHPGCGPGT